jgi:hypothetical protein
MPSPFNDQRKVGTMLAALHYYQRGLLHDTVPDEILDLAKETSPALTLGEIDELIHDIIFYEEAPAPPRKLPRSLDDL